MELRELIDFTRFQQGTHFFIDMRTASILTAQPSRPLETGSKQEVGDHGRCKERQWAIPALFPEKSRRWSHRHSGDLHGIGEIRSGGGLYVGSRKGAPGKSAVTLKVNGKSYRVEVEHRHTLAEVLRDQLGLTGTKIGCDRGECGACTVIINGRNMYSCSQLAIWMEGKEILTIEGLAKGDKLDPLQEAFIEHDGPQCGFCTSGQIMSGKALLMKNSKPTEAQARRALSGNPAGVAIYNREVAAGSRRCRQRNKGGRHGRSTKRIFHCRQKNSAHRRLRTSQRPKPSTPVTFNFRVCSTRAFCAARIPTRRSLASILQKQRSYLGSRRWFIMAMPKYRGLAAAIRTGALSSTTRCAMSAMRWLQ